MNSKSKSTVLTISLTLFTICTVGIWLSWCILYQSQINTTTNQDNLRAFIAKEENQSHVADWIEEQLKINSKNENELENFSIHKTTIKGAAFNAVWFWFSDKSHINFINFEIPRAGLIYSANKTDKFGGIEPLEAFGKFYYYETKARAIPRPPLIQLYQIISRS